MNFKSIVKLRERPEVRQLIKILQTDFATELEDDDALSRIQPAQEVLLRRYADARRKYSHPSSANTI